MDAERWKRLSPLLDALLELHPRERDAALLAHRNDDPALADELERLLRMEADDATFLSEPVIEHPADAGAGSRIGPYQLQRLLGEGGMGQVWLAARADGLYERQVALKLLRPGLADTSLRQRFDRERDILARFAHPFIARLLDAGIARDGQPYLALEYVEGEPITDYCRRHALPIPARLDLFRQVCDAVSHAHASLIVHRDLKPSNILVTAEGQVRLLDFGIAKLLDVDPLPAEQTRTGVRAFTLHYAAPEQIRGEPVTTMTDVYSLGVVLHELLTGSKPYRLKRQTDAEWEQAILDGEPSRPSHAAARADAADTAPYSPARMARELAGDLDNIVLKALAKVPLQRYVSAEALSQDLLAYLRGRPVMARGQGLPYRARKFLRRHRWAITASASIVALLLGALGVVAWQAQRAERETLRAQAMQRFVADLFADAGSSPNTPIDLRSLLDMGILRGESSLMREPQARAELYGVVARLKLGLGDYREAEALLRRQERLLAALPDAPRSLRLEGAALHGSVHRQLGNLRGCVAVMRPLEALAGNEEGRLPAQAAAFHAQLGRCHRELGNTPASRQLHQRALHLRKGIGDVPGVAESMLDLAALESDRGDARAAIAILDDALAQLQAGAGERHPLVIDILRSRCSLKRALDEVSAAVADCRASLQLARDLRGPGHRETVDANRQLAALYVDLGRFNDAEAIFVDALGWMRARLDPLHPDMARAYNSLAITAWERGDIDRARDYQQQAIKAWRATPHEGQSSGGLFNMAMILASTGDHAGALPLLDEAGAMRTRQYGRTHPLVGDNERLRGEVLDALGRSTEAGTALRNAVRLTRAGYGDGHSHTRRALISLARFRARHGADDAAADLAAQGRIRGRDMEQRKASWLARAYAAETACTTRPHAARLQLEAVLAELRPAMPEGGALTREITRIRDRCGRAPGEPTMAAATAATSPAAAGLPHRRA